MSRSAQATAEEPRPSGWRQLLTYSGVLAFAQDVVLVLGIAFGPALIGLVVATVAFLRDSLGVLNAIGPIAAVWVHLCIPYLSAALPSADQRPQMAVPTAVLITFAQLTLIRAVVARVFGAPRTIRAAVAMAIGTIAASSFLAYALLSTLDFVSYNL